MIGRARYAIYFAPRVGEPLHTFGTHVLGRCAEKEAVLPVFPELTRMFPDWSTHVEQTAHYGFHATLKAPFELAEGADEQSVHAGVETVASTMAQLSIGHLHVTPMGRCLALRPIHPTPELWSLASTVVSSLDGLRAPLTAEDRARRHPQTLSPSQRINLDRWGYPFVFNDFEFHMSLTGRCAPDLQTRAATVLSGQYARFDMPILLRDLCLFRQPDRRSAFRLLRRFPLAASHQ
jgi:hypothetical protein